MPTLLLQRTLSKRTGDDKIHAQIEHILKRGLDAGRGKTWEHDITHAEPIKQNSGWHFRVKIELRKKSGQRGTEAEYKQWENIKAMIQQAGAATKYQPFPWNVTELGANQTPTTIQTVAQSEQSTATPESFESVIGDLNNTITKIMGVREVQPFGMAKTWSELIVPDDLLGSNSDEALSRHPAWQNLYGVNPQIRVVLSNIKRAQETDGESRNHAVLFGHAGCGKTTTMFALENMFGSGSVLKLDATSTTRAGLEKLFFNDLNEIPPLVFMEEAEKADPEALKIWLGALDDRGEIRKINFRVNQLRSLKILFICSVNNKAAFDKMMGSDGSEAGALSSRCVTQVYYPRPTDAILHQILTKEIREKGGNMDWIPPALGLAKEMGVSDPRIVRSYLAGGDRLLSGSYQRDWQAIYNAQKAFNK